jgi:putative OPT family oligopeptide transporter
MSEEPQAGAPVRETVDTVSPPSDDDEFGTIIADPGDGPVYRPHPSERQLTLRAILAGCLLGGFVAAMNVYLGLQIGWSFGGSLIAAILSYSLFAAILRPRLRFGPLETNIAQTAGSACGAMASSAGLLAAIPALGMLGHEFSYWQLTLWAGSVAWLGIFYAVPLRRQMVVEEKLRFPTGTATANTIIAMFGSGEDALLQSQALIRCAVAAGVFALASFFVPQLSDPPLHEWIPIAILSIPAAYSFTLLISPAFLGAGILIGMRVCASLAFGALVAWGVIAPWIESLGWVGPKVMSYQEGARGWVLWPGVALMVSDALTNLVLSWRTILSTFKRKENVDKDAVDHSDKIPNTWWVGGIVVAGLLTVTTGKLVFDVPIWLTVVAIGLSSLLAVIATRSVGETDINPIGGMGKITQLAYGVIAPGQVTTNLVGAAITSSGASQAADMMQDLKTGHLLGASPRKQLLAQLCGIAAGTFIVVPIYMLFNAAYEIGGEKMPAPAAHSWKAMAELLTHGIDAMPQHAGWAVLVAAVFASLAAVVRKWRPQWGFVPSGLAMGIAFIVPAKYSIAMFLGAICYLIWKRRNAKSAEALGFAVASGLVAGEGLMGIVNAGLTLLGVSPLTGG